MATERVRVYAVANLRTGRIHGMTCDVNQSAAWVRELVERYDDTSAAVQCVDLVDPAEQEIPWRQVTPVTNEPTPSTWPFRVEVMDLPPGVDAVLVSSVEPHEIRKGETAIDALVRLKRAVVVREVTP